MHRRRHCQRVRRRLWVAFRANPGSQSRHLNADANARQHDSRHAQRIAVFCRARIGTVFGADTVASDRQVDWAQLNVYLFDGSSGLGYCGQNIPDAPTWGPFSKGQRASVTITGWQISRVPCQVTSIRAWLHIRDNGLLIPPTDSQTVASGTLDVNYTFR